MVRTQKTIPLAIVLSILLVGCASQGVNTAQFKEGESITVENEVTVSKPYSQVWDKFVRELSKSYYVINNIDKESRIINLSFNSNSPADFVECGSTTRTFTRGDQKETYSYKVASSATFKAATPRQPHPAFHYYSVVRRTTNLEGRTNIYLAPDETNPSKTRVAVNTRYVLGISLKGETYQENIHGTIISSAPLTPDQFSIAFNTNKPARQDMGGTAVTCSGNGKLEREILGLIRD